MQYSAIYQGLRAYVLLMISRGKLYNGLLLGTEFMVGRKKRRSDSGKERVKSSKQHATRKRGCDGTSCSLVAQHHTSLEANRRTDNGCAYGLTHQEPTIPVGYVVHAIA